MSYTTFSNESVVQKATRDLGVSLNFLCALAGDVISPSSISLWLNGTRKLDDSQTRPLVEIISELRAIVDEYNPMPLLFKDADLWKQILALRRSRNDYHAGAQALSGIAGE